jgi:hypothetical protein
MKVDISNKDHNNSNMSGDNNKKVEKGRSNKSSLPFGMNSP